MDILYTTSGSNFICSRINYIMNASQLEKEIVKALDINANVDWDSNETHPSTEFKDLKKFVKKLFREYRGEE